MNEIEKQQLIDRIRNVLQSRRFSDWYGDDGNFGKWTTGDLPKVCTAQVNQDIERMFLK